MAHFTTSLSIDASPERVFDVMTDLHRWAERMSAITRVEVLTEGPIGVGTRFRETRTVFKREATEEMEITAMERPRAYTIVGESCGARFTTTHTLTREGSGTRFEITMKAEPITFMARLVSPLTRLMMGSCEKAVRKDLEELKATIEGREGPAPESAQVAGAG